MKYLGVNIDHVATLRQARGTTYPSILSAALCAIKGGADQITIHLREDRRHIQDEDVYKLKEAVNVPLNLEMAMSEEIINIALDVKPETVTLVPEKRRELTTEGGLDCIGNREKLKTLIRRMEGAGIGVSFFIDPERTQVEMAKELGAFAIELHTGSYCEAEGEDADSELNKLIEAARLAKSLEFKVCAGHGLHYQNMKKVVTSVPEIVEYNIGHSIIARAVFTGIETAVKDMKNLIK